MNKSRSRTQTCREESWGTIRYDRQMDEFEAHSRAESINIDRPISVGCLVTGRCNLACQFCYGNDEALPPPASEMGDIQSHPKFDLLRHGRKWLSSILPSGDLTYSSSN